MSIVDKAKEVAKGLGLAAALEVLRGYVVDRIKKVHPDDLVDAIERDDYDIISKLSEKDKKTLRTVGVRFIGYLGVLTTENVMQWLMEDVPFLAGIIYGHPKGLKWLDSVLTNIKEYVKGSVRLYPAQQ